MSISLKQTHFQIFFQAIRGGSFQSDFAIDDILVEDVCSGPGLNFTFELYFDKLKNQFSLTRVLVRNYSTKKPKKD